MLPPLAVTLPLTALFAVVAPRAQEPTPTLVVRGGQLFEPERAAVRPLGQLWIAGDRVLGERAADTAIPAGTAVLDASGGTVLPGLFDLHAHVDVHGGGFFVHANITADDNLATALLCGVTNVVDLHADQRTIFALRERARHAPDLARLWCAGGAFTAPRGHGSQFGYPTNVVTTAAEVDACYATLAPLQPDVIKLIVEHGNWGGLPKLPTLDGPLARAVVDGAHAHHLRAWSHVWTTAEARTAVDAGADALAHGVFLGELDAELLAAMRAHKTDYVPTLAVMFAAVRARAGRSPYDRPLVREVLHPRLVEALADQATDKAAARLPLARFAAAQEAQALANLKAAADAGLRLGIGTDAGNPFVPHGPAVFAELELFVAAGLSPAQALRAATLDAAAILGVGDRFGSLAAGKVADLVLVHGDPLAQFDAIWNVEQTVKDGRLVDREPMRVRNRERAAPPKVVRIADAAQQPAFGFGGAFVAIDDRDSGGKSTAALVADGKALAVVRGEVRAGSYAGACVGAEIVFHPERRMLVDASALRGLRLTLRGSERPLTLTVHCAAVKDGRAFTATVQPRATTTTIDVPFADLQQSGMGRKVAWTATDLTGLALAFRSPAMERPVEGAVELTIEAIAFY